MSGTPGAIRDFCQSRQAATAGVYSGLLGCLQYAWTSFGAPRQELGSTIAERFTIKVVRMSRRSSRKISRTTMTEPRSNVLVIYTLVDAATGGTTVFLLGLTKGD
jgi:hypothetical protein